MNTASTPIGANLGEILAMAENGKLNAPETAPEPAAHPAPEPAQPATAAAVMEPPADINLAHLMGRSTDAAPAPVRVEPAQAGAGVFQEDIAELARMLERPADAPPAPKRAAHPAPARIQPREERELSLRFVAVELVPEERGRITMDAQTPHTGRIITGPTAFNLEMDYPSFINGLRERELKFYRFRMDMATRRISRGSIVAEVPGHHVCPACGHTAVLDHVSLKRARNETGTRNPTCTQCAGCVEMRWERNLPEPLGAGDERAKYLYERFTAARKGKLQETRGLLPRVWGVYPITGAPTEWVPHPGDAMAQEIERRENLIGMTARPFRAAFAAQSSGLLSLVLESTINADGKPGMATGWLSRESLTGGLKDEYGFTVRMQRQQRRRKARKFTV